eukprot:3383097-Alexandrium_andersonii.AAC.1
MSASLVGSEMCIRDRLLFVLVSHGNPPENARSFSPQRLLCGELGRKAVSYTHLTLPTICSV